MRNRHRLQTALLPDSELRARVEESILPPWTGLRGVEECRDDIVLPEGRTRPEGSVR